MRETLDSILLAIGSYGFPIVVTGYLLWERTKVQTETNKALASLSQAITLLSEYIKGKGE